MPDLVATNRSEDGGFSKGGPSQGDVLFAFLRNSHIFASTIRETLRLDPLRDADLMPLTPSQLCLLRLIGANGRLSVGQAASLLGVSAPASAKAIHKLEHLGLVRRMRCRSDRRARLVSIRAIGREWLDRYEKRKAARLTSVLQGFAPAEVDAFARLLTRFAVSLLREQDAHDVACLRCAAYFEEGCPVGQIRGGCPYQRSRTHVSAPRAAHAQRKDAR